MSEGDAASANWERVNQLLERQVTQGQSMTVTRYRFSPAGRFPLHRHEQEQFVYCVTGSLVFHVEGRTHPIAQGDTLLIAAMKVHDAVAEAHGAEVVSVVAPARPTDSAIEVFE